MPQIDVYTQDWCPYCVRAKQLLDRKGAAYREIHAPGGSAERNEARERSGRTTVPQIFIDGRSIGGCDELIALDRSGGLDTLLTSEPPAATPPAA